MDVPAWMPVIFYAVMLMLFLGAYSWRHIEHTSERKPFSYLAFMTAFMLVNDFVSRLYIYDWFPGWVVVVCTYINFAVLPLLGAGWYQFVRSILSAEERTRARRLNTVVYGIATIGMFVLVINPIIPLVFSFDAAGTYHRGPLFFVPAGSTFLCIVISEIFLSLHVRSLGTNVFVSMLAFPLPPLIGGIVAMFLYGVPWMPLGISLSMVVLFATLQTTSLGRDFLTGLNNRRKFDELLGERVTWAQHGHSFAAILVDLDDFKAINDTLGHSVGDIALSEAAKIMQRSVRNDDVVSRLGGDEFAILLEDVDQQRAEEIMKRIEEEVRAFNDQNKEFSLALSMGCKVFEPGEFSSAEAYMEYIDALMYANKAERKRLRQLQATG